MAKINFWIVFTALSLFLISENIFALPSSDKPDQSPLPADSGNNFNLTLQDAIYYSLRGNNDIKIASYAPQIAEEQLEKTQSVYDPVFILSGGANRLDRPVQSTLDTGEVDDTSLVEDRWSSTAKLKQHVFTGGSLSIFQEVGDLDSSSTYVLPNPQNTSRLTGLITQPLLRGIGDKENRSSIQIAQTNIAMSKEEFQQKVMEVMLQVINSYWQVHFNRENFLLSNESLKMAEEIYRREKARLKQGISKQRDVDRSIAAIETRRNTLYKARMDLDNSVNRLKYLLSSPNFSIENPEADLIPTEIPTVDVYEIKTEDALAIALKSRPEIFIANQKLKMAQLKMDLAGHKKLPRLDAKVDYTLSSLDTNAGDAIKEVYKGNNSGWSVWLEFEMPLGNSEAISEYQISNLEYKRVQGNIKKIKEQVITEVYSTTKELENAANQIQTAETALQATEKVLSSEEALYQLAKTSNEDLLQKQFYVYSSKQVYLRAVVHYNKTLAKFSRVKGMLLEDYHVDVSKNRD